MHRQRSGVNLVTRFRSVTLLIIIPLKEYCALLFFKGALLNDANGFLIKPGENTQAGRQIRFTNVREIVEMETILKAYIYEAIEVKKDTKIRFYYDIFNSRKFFSILIPLGLVFIDSG